METGSERLEWAPLVLDAPKIEFLWGQIQQFPQVFDDFSAGKMDDFVGRLFNPYNIFVDIGPNKGLACGMGVRPGLDAVIHLVMFDRRLRGREPLFLDILSYFFRRLRLRRVTAMIAEDAATAIKLVQRLGFQQEGLLRRALLRGGKGLDVHVYGLLTEELDASLKAYAS